MELHTLSLLCDDIHASYLHAWPDSEISVWIIPHIAAHNFRNPYRLTATYTFRLIITVYAADETYPGWNPKLSERTLLDTTLDQAFIIQDFRDWLQKGVHS